MTESICAGWVISGLIVGGVSGFGIAKRANVLQYSRQQIEHIRTLRDDVTTQLDRLYAHSGPGITVQADVIQRVLARGNLARILLGLIAHRSDLRLPIQRIVIEVELRIEREQATVRRHDQRIHFDE